MEEKIWSLRYNLSGGIAMSTIGLTPEQRRLIEQAGDQPVRLEDPETNETYLLIRAKVYEQVRDVRDPRSVLDLRVPEGVLRSQEAFFRELPELMNHRNLRGKFVAYQGDERVIIARSEVEVIRECLRRGLQSDEYDIFVIRPQSQEPEAIDYPSAWSEL
jgi:hypothetical protein